MSYLFCRSKKRTVLVIAICIVVPALIIIFKSLSADGDLLTENCRNEYSDIFMAKLCSNYSKKLAHGNMCSSLCDRHSFEKQGCIQHSNTIVIDGKLNGKKIAIKWKKPKWPDKSTIEDLKIILDHGHFKNYSQKTFWKDLVLDKLENVVSEAINERTAIEKDIIFKNLKAPLLFDEEIAASFLSLAENDEYAMLGTFQELQHLPKLYGYCGQAYVMEKLVPYSYYFPALVHKLDWKTTVKLALSFLDMVAELETAKGGPLQHCDVQEGNFGITDEGKIKLIDIDLVLTKGKANTFLSQPNCSSNSDCDFFDCISMCDVKKGKCLARRITSNLQVLCRDIFKSGWPLTGLFGNMPSSIRPMITPLLADCSSVRFGHLPFSHQKVKDLLRNFRFLLSKSINAG